MAHFIAYAQGRSKTTASRLGTKRTGVTARAQGWDIGGTVEMMVDSEGRDVVVFTLTPGSTGVGWSRPVARFVLQPDGTVTREV